MKNALLDIVKVVNILPFTVVKLTGHDGDVIVQSGLAAESVYLNGKITKKIPELDGVFGLSNIPMLSGLINVQAFQDTDANVKVKYQERNGIKIPEEIAFEKDGFGKASYRLTNQKAIPEQANPVVKLDWDVTIEQPTKRKLADFAQVAGIYSSQESRFSIKTENGQLKFLIGDDSAATHKAQFVFAENVTGEVKYSHTWKISTILSILKLGNNASTKMSINDQKGCLQIEVDTGVGVYKFLCGGSN